MPSASGIVARIARYPAESVALAVRSPKRLILAQQLAVYLTTGCCSGEAIESGIGRQRIRGVIARYRKPAVRVRIKRLINQPAQHQVAKVKPEVGVCAMR